MKIVFFVVISFQSYHGPQDHFMAWRKRLNVMHLR